MERQSQTPAPRIPEAGNTPLRSLGPDRTGADEISGHTVHVIEVNERKLLFLCDFLSVQGLRVTGSSDPERALQYVSKARPEVLICDVAMAPMGGAELLERVRQVSPETVMIFTMDRGTQQVVECVGKGGKVNLLLGPLSAPGLLDAVGRILRA